MRFNLGVASNQTVAIVGATGAVGSEFLRLFADRKFPVGELRLLASSRSVGRALDFEGSSIPVMETTKNAFDGVDIAFFSAGASRSREFVPVALAAGATVIDNSSAFRMDSTVPLVVPEINAAAIGNSKLVAVPNCSAIILLMAVNPLRELGTLERLIVSTYQSASGGGASMMQQLLDETALALRNAPIPESSLGTPYAFNLFSHNTPIGNDGYNEEEAKVISESRKILGMPELKLNVTCIRVPVVRAHSESVTVEFSATAPSLDAVRAVLAAASGVRVIDDRENNRFPTPRDASGQGDVLVGRIRQDVSNPNAISMFVCGDQLLKGAALNAVQIAEFMMAHEAVRAP